MTNRREFLEAAAMIGLPAAAGIVQARPLDAAGASVPARLDLHGVLVDERYSEARTLAASLARAGAPIHPVSQGDVTHLWLSQIGPAWRHQPVPLAGLTARPALFCLEQLALSYGLRVVFHGEHVVHPDGQVEHSILRGADDALLSVRDLKRAGARWPARIADAIAAHRELARPLRPGRSDAALEPNMPAGAQLLTSWIIA